MTKLDPLIARFDRVLGLQQDPVKTVITLQKDSVRALLEFPEPGQCEDLRLKMEGIKFGQDGLESLPAGWSAVQSFPKSFLVWPPWVTNSSEFYAHLYERLRELKHLLLSARHRLQMVRNGKRKRSTKLKPPFSKGRKRDLHITRGINILESEMRGHKHIQDPRQRWEMIFENRVCPECIDGWHDKNDEDKKAVRKGMRASLAYRGGIGRPPDPSNGTAG